MDAIWWILIITIVWTTVLWLIQIVWVTFWGLIPPVGTLIMSYWVAKWASKPLLKEARIIKKYVGTALKILPDSFISTLKNKANGAKGGSSTSDPLGDWLSEKTGGFTDIFKKPKGDNARVEQIIKEESEKAGIKINWPSKDKEVPAGSVPMPTVK